MNSPKKPKAARPTVAMRAGELKKLLPKLKEERKEWAESVLGFNPPGQLVYADKEMLEACEKEAGATVKRDGVPDPAPIEKK